MMTGGDLVQWRRLARLSQAALARLVGVDVMTVSRWERGLTRPPAMLELALESPRALAAVRLALAGRAVALPGRSPALAGPGLPPRRRRGPKPRP